MKQLLADPPDKQMVKELEDGTLEFSKLTPWGVGKYTRKKAEMTDDEKVIWEKYKKSRTAGSQQKEAKEQQK